MPRKVIPHFAGDHGTESTELLYLLAVRPETLFGPPFVPTLEVGGFDVLGLGGWGAPAAG
jgi:hypothetical protein